MRAQQTVAQVMQGTKAASKMAATIMTCIIIFVVGVMFGSLGRDVSDLSMPVAYILGPFLALICWHTVQLRICGFCRQAIERHYEKEADGSSENSNSEGEAVQRLDESETEQETTEQ